MRWFAILVLAFALTSACNYAELSKLQILLQGTSVGNPPSIPFVAPPQQRTARGRNLARAASSPSEISLATPPPPRSVLAPFEPAEYARLDQATRSRLGWVHFWQVEAFIAVLFLMALAIYLFLFERFGRDLTDQESLRNMQLLLILVGIGGAAAHIFWVGAKTGNAYAPNFDLVALGWLAIGMVGFLLPRLEEFGFAGATFKLKDTIKSIGDLAESSTDLLQNWTESINLLSGWFASEPQQAPERIYGFIRDRAGEASEWLSAPGDDGFMLSVWNYDRDGLQILYPKNIGGAAVSARVWRAGEGCLGQAFLEQRMWNEKNARTLPAYVVIHNEYQDYKGILLVPIRYGNEARGMLCVRRKKEAYFAPEQENVACALSQILAYAMGSAPARLALAHAIRPANKNASGRGAGGADEPTGS